MKYILLYLTDSWIENLNLRAEINQLNAPKLYTSLFTYTMAPTCFGKTMPFSGSDYISLLSHFSVNMVGDSLNTIKSYNKHLQGL
jgi:hypothetical protein